MHSRGLNLRLISFFMIAAIIMAFAPLALAQSAKIDIVATTGMIADIIRAVGGELVEVHQMMGPGVDPHLYRAAERDIDLLLEADMLFYNGLNLEAKLTDVFEQIGQERPAVPVSRDIPEERILVEADYQTSDPHIWFDVSLWMIATGTVRDALIEFDPRNEASYAGNAEAYLEELAELHDYAREKIATIPEQQRVLVTAHDAFQYFGHAYGIEVFAPQGISTETEAGVADIRRMIELVDSRSIPAIFIETSVPSDVVEAIIAGVEDRGRSVRLGGLLFSDAMGEPGTPEGTYVGMIRHNVDTIVAALSGQSEGNDEG